MEQICLYNKTKNPQTNVYGFSFVAKTGVEPVTSGL